METLKEEREQERQQLKATIKDLEVDRHNLISQIGDQDDYIRYLTRIKPEDEFDQMSSLTKRFDKLLDTVDMQRQHMISNLSNMSVLCNFKQIEEDKLLRIQNRQVQT
mmetsp:Transcript_27616/g.26641  ORF Transcript_27616/g.26641 Transcript_27616/m.26641 type:complete len:108 (-) Transcript_27616:340-663(-)